MTLPIEIVCYKYYQYNNSNYADQVVLIMAILILKWILFILKRVVISFIVCP